MAEREEQQLVTLRQIMISSLVIITLARPALAQEQASGADASNPTAAVNYQDARYRYFDLDQGADKHSFETEGAYMLHPRFKLTNELPTCQSFVFNVRQDLAELRPRHSCTGHTLNVSKHIGRKKSASSRLTQNPQGGVYPLCSARTHAAFSTKQNS